MNDTTSLISIAICTHNRAKFLQGALNSLVLQSQTTKFKVIIVDNLSTDNSKEIIDKFKNKLSIKYIHENRLGLGFARNAAVSACRTSYIIFIDDDAKADSDWINNIVSLISTRKVDIFGGPIYPFYLQKKPGWFKDTYETRGHGSKPRYLTEKEFLSGSNIGFRKTIIKKVGGFNPELGPKSHDAGVGEETNLQQKAASLGYKRYYSPALKVTHWVPIEKMTIKYRLVRKLKILSTHQTTHLYTQSLARQTLRLGISLARIGYYCIKLPIRNKSQYPYWQNYVIECMIPKIFLPHHTAEVLLKVINYSNG